MSLIYLPALTPSAFPKLSHELSESNSSRIRAANLIIKNEKTNPVLGIKSNYEDDLFKKRIDYINNLRTLSEDWVTPKAKIPSEKAIKISEHIFKLANNYIEASTQYQYSKPKILLGPIPIGGIGLDFIYNDENSLSIYIFNDKEPELASCINRFYKEIETTTEELTEKFTFIFNEFLTFHV